MAKGDFNGECNRTACNNKHAKYFNYSTEKYYCSSCAALINKHNPVGKGEYELCTLVIEPQEKN